MFDVLREIAEGSRGQANCFAARSRL